MNNYIYQRPYLVLCYVLLAYYYHNIKDLMKTVFSANNTVKLMIPIVINMSDGIWAYSLEDIHRHSNRHRRHLVQSPSPSQIYGNQHVMDICSIAFPDQFVYSPVVAWCVCVESLWFRF